MGYEVETVDLQPQPAAVVRGDAELDGIADFLGAAYGEVAQVLASEGLAPAGPPFARYSLHDRSFGIEAGFPVARTVTPEGRVVAGQIPGGHAARTVHHGSYDDLPAAYEAVEEWLAHNGYVPTGDPWETYLDEPDVPEPRTLVHVPCRSLRHA
ncbi:GyrI-like domain-containing protein [Nocardioides guangzhouensis]|nr:GyrI-like domain-containing protein [Nocardioides guangzhouensis]